MPHQYLDKKNMKHRLFNLTDEEKNSIRSQQYVHK